MAEQITIISDLLKKDPAYKEVVDQLEDRLYNRYMVYLADKPKFNDKTSIIPKPYLVQMLSFKNTLELNKIAKKYNLSQEQRDSIPNILWKIFYREAEIKNLPQMLNSELNINNIKTSYQISTDIANLYMPISDYLGDVGMVIKKWQYEMPVGEPTINELAKIRPQAPQAAAMQPQTAPKITVQQAQAPTIEKLPVASYQPPAAGSPIPPPIRPPINLQPTAYNLQPESKDESIPKVQETLSRIAAASNRITDQIQKAAQEQAQQPTQPQPIKQTSQSKNISSHTSDLEPEYLPDEQIKPINKSNIIDLKNF